jgi:hypothetical protein
MAPNTPPTVSEVIPIPRLLLNQYHETRSAGIGPHGTAPEQWAATRRIAATEYRILDTNTPVPRKEQVKAAISAQLWRILALK